MESLNFTSTVRISTQTSTPSPSLLPKSPIIEFDVILSTYPDIVQPCNTEAPVKHNVTHHINTVGAPVHAHPCRLSPEHLKAARQEFEHMLQQEPSIPHLAAGLHHYKWFQRNQMIGIHVGITELSTTLQCQTTTQSHIYKILQGSTIFSKIDLVSAYHQIPVGKTSISRTAITCTTPFRLFKFDQCRLV